jgi:hypothetical protein
MEGFLGTFQGGTVVRKATLRVGVAALAVAGLALVVGAQGPPGGFGDRGPRQGGMMEGMFEFREFMGGFGGKTVTGKPFQATFTITRTESLPGNSITNTTSGTFARDTDGSTYRDVKLPAIGPWASSGKPPVFAYIRNLPKITQYIVNVTKGTYEAIPIRQHDSSHDGGPKRFAPGKGGDGSGSSNEAVTDNPNATYTDPVTTNMYKVDDRKITRTIPAGQIGNQFDIVITIERWYSSDLELLLQETRSDPRFGTTNYQLTNIGQPQSSLFLPNPSFTQVQGKGFERREFRGEGKQPPPPPPQD